MIAVAELSTTNVILSVSHEKGFSSGRTAMEIFLICKVGIGLCRLWLLYVMLDFIIHWECIYTNTSQLETYESSKNWVKLYKNYKVQKEHICYWQVHWIIVELESIGGRKWFVYILYILLVEVGLHSLNLVERVTGKVLIQTNNSIWWFVGFRATFWCYWVQNYFPDGTSILFVCWRDWNTTLASINKWKLWIISETYLVGILWLAFGPDYEVLIEQI